LSLLFSTPLFPADAFRDCGAEFLSIDAIQAERGMFA
jgi:hypothetical protein